MIVAEIVVLLGSVLTLISAIGMVRFGDVYSRMHALTKASTLGVVFVLVGAAVTLSNPNDITSLALAAILQILTSPVGSNILSLATYDASSRPPPDGGASSAGPSPAPSIAREHQPHAHDEGRPPEPPRGR